MIFWGPRPLQYYIIVHIKGVTAIMSKLNHELQVNGFVTFTHALHNKMKNAFQIRIESFLIWLAI